MGSKKYDWKKASIRRCNNCGRIGCPDKEERLKNPKPFCAMFTTEEIPFSIEPIVDNNNWRQKMDQLNRMNQIG